jgi:hypothetical protein
MLLNNYSVSLFKAIFFYFLHDSILQKITGSIYSFIQGDLIEPTLELFNYPFTA